MYSFNPCQIRYFFSWINHSDCGTPCNEQDYRYQSKLYPIAKKSGFFWQGELKDSIDQLTISHHSLLNYRADDSVMDSLSHKYLKLKIINNSDYSSVAHDTIEKIGSQYFSIFVMRKEDSIHAIRVLAVTTINGNEINFQYDLLTKKNDLIEKEFIKNSIDLIRTIKISKKI